MHCFVLFFQTHPEKKIEEEKKEFDALIHSHCFLLSLFVPPLLLPLALVSLSQ